MENISGHSEYKISSKILKQPIYTLGGMEIKLFLGLSWKFGWIWNRHCREVSGSPGQTSLLGSVQDAIFNIGWSEPQRGAQNSVGIWIWQRFPRTQWVSKAIRFWRLIYYNVQTQGQKPWGSTEADMLRSWLSWTFLPCESLPSSL
jgi:hypothetical protein